MSMSMAPPTIVTAPVASSRISRNQKVFLFLCVAALFLNYLDRATVSISATSIRQDLGLTGTQVGGLLSLFSLSYALGSLPAGFLVDRFGVRKLSSLAILIWSLVQGAGGLVAQYAQLLVTRAALGVAEAPIGPANVRVVASWYPAHLRGLPTGIYVSGTQLGPAFAPPLLTALMLWLGWRGMFIAMAVIGCICAIGYFAVYRDVESANLTSAERDYLGMGAEADVVERVTGRSWLNLFRYRTCWGLMMGSFFQNWTSWIFVGWLPLYLETEFHLSIARTGIVAAFPFIGGVAGSMFGGFMSDFLERRGFSMLNSRKFPIVFGTLGLAFFTGATGFASSLPAAVGLSFCALFCWSTALAGMWAAVAVLVPRPYVASVSTIFNSCGAIGATLSPLATGRILDVTGSFFGTLMVGTAMGVCGAAAIAFMIRGPITKVEGKPGHKLVDTDLGLPDAP